MKKWADPKKSGIRSPFTSIQITLDFLTNAVR